MSPDDILNIAHEADLHDYEPGGALERFARLLEIATILRCAEMCEQLAKGWHGNDGLDCAAELRALLPENDR